MSSDYRRMAEAITPREDHALLDDDHNVVPFAVWQDGELDTDALLEWARRFEDIESRRVAETVIDGVRVSTVFLGLDHGFGGAPMWFETMIFGGSDYEERCTTWAEAEKMHERAILFLAAREPSE